MSLMKSTITHKLRITQKKSFVRSIIVTSIPIFPAKNYAKQKNIFRGMGSSLVANNSKTKNLKNLKYDYSFDSAQAPSFM